MESVFNEPKSKQYEDVTNSKKTVNKIEVTPGKDLLTLQFKHTYMSEAFDSVTYEISGDCKVYQRMFFGLVAEGIML